MINYSLGNCYIYKIIQLVDAPDFYKRIAKIIIFWLALFARKFQNFIF